EGLAASSGCSNYLGTILVAFVSDNSAARRLGWTARLVLCRAVLGWALLAGMGLCWIGPASAQITQPVWYPPLSLYGRPIAQPYFDLPTWARYANCRPPPLAWGYDPFVNYGPCDGAGADVPTVACPGNFVAHRPSGWYGSADFAPLTIDHLDGFALARIGPT